MILPSATTHAPVERRDVDQMRRAELLGVPQAVAEDEPALGVGVVDLDRQPGRAVSTSPGFIARPPGMFSVDGDDDDRRGSATRSSATRGSAAMTVAPPAMSSFIRSMPSAGLIEMPPVSNVMPLPTKPSTGERWRAFRLVARDEHPRRLGTPSRDAEEQAHAELLHPLLVEHVDGDARQREQGLTAIDEFARGQAIARLVDEDARGVDDIAHAESALSHLCVVSRCPRWQSRRSRRRTAHPDGS